MEGRRRNAECRKRPCQSHKKLRPPDNPALVALPKDTAAQVLEKQALRSGTSVGANYREANRARSKAEFVSKVGDCLKEADETAYWLELLADEGIVLQKRLGPLLKETNELIAILVTISKRARGD